MIQILTDSAADLSGAEKFAPGLHIVPLRVVWPDGAAQRDGFDLTADEFYTRLAGSEKLPRTSQPSPQDFAPVFEAAKAAGEPVVAILISSTLSGTLQSAQLAAADCEFEDVYFIDSRSASVGEATLLREALRLRAQGLPAAEIAAALEELKSRICILAVVDSLKHLHKGGRLPGAIALVGGALGIKPVLSVMDGAIQLADKARGRPGAFVALFRQIEKLGGIDPAYGYSLLYSDSRQVAAPIHHYMHHNLNLTGGHVVQLGSVIGTHVGPNVAGVCFVRRQNAD